MKLNEELSPSQKLKVCEAFGNFSGICSAIAAGSVDRLDLFLDDEESRSAVAMLGKAKTRQEFLNCSLVFLRNVEKWMIKAGAK